MRTPHGGRPSVTQAGQLRGLDAVVGVDEDAAHEFVASRLVAPWIAPLPCIALQLNDSHRPWTSSRGPVTTTWVDSPLAWTLN